MIHGRVRASKPKTMQDAIEIATKLRNKKISTLVECQTENKKRLDNTSKNNQNQQQPNKRQNTGRAYTAGHGEKKHYGKGLCHNSIKNDLRKLKGKDIVDNATQVSNTTIIGPRMSKLDPVTLVPKDKNNRETHIYYLKHTMEQAPILKEIVEQAKSLNPLDSVSYSACKYVKLIQELLRYVRDTCPDIHKPIEKFIAVTPINKKKIVRITATNKVPLRELIPLEVVAQESVVTNIYNRRPKVPKTNGSNSKHKIAKSLISNKTEPDTSRRSNTSVAPSSSLVDLRKPDFSYLYVFGALCYPNNDSEDLGKLQAKSDIVPVTNAPRAGDLANSYVSTSIDQDVPSTNSKNFLQAMTKPSWIDAMQEEITNLKEYMFRKW
nr:integrase, catalytic region, zinc finger, CCHC-type, peptidase aspartic, catalytic [Tanacetum cinerariifolium]